MYSADHRGEQQTPHRREVTDDRQAEQHVQEAAAAHHERAAIVSLSTPSYSKIATTRHTAIDVEM